MIPERSGHSLTDPRVFCDLLRGMWAMSDDDRETSYPPRGWYGRGYLPHFDGDLLTQVVTFRLADSLPRGVVDRWKSELKQLAPKDAKTRLFRRIEKSLDSGFGDCHLRDPRIGRLVEDALLFFDRQRYDLHAWVIMPNHVHVLFTQLTHERLEKVLHSWKSFTSTKANRVLRREGTFWQQESYDRFIRDQSHFLDAMHYIEENPVIAGLCRRKADWEFGSARKRTGSRGGDS